MQVELEPLKIFKLTYNGITVEATYVQRWNGMVEFSTKHGSIIIDLGVDGDGVLEFVYRALKHPGETDMEGSYTVVKISPVLANKLGFKEVKDGQKS